jgi:iron(III) transport system ATP-binding protein
VGRFVLQANLVQARRQGQVLLTAVGPLVAEGAAIPTGADLEVLLLPESLDLEEAADGPARVVGREFQGRHWIYLVECAGERLRVRRPLACELVRGAQAHVRLRAGETALLYPGGLRIQAQRWNT